MGASTQKVLQVINTNEMAMLKPAKIQKPASKTVLKYISPITVTQENVQAQLEQVIDGPEVSFQMLANKEEEDQPDGSEQTLIEQIQEIKVKWNNFIKMKQRNYLDDYQIVRQIGRGGYGKVYKARSKYTGLFRAAKKIKKSTLGKEDHQKLFSEMAIMQSLDHNNIARLFEVYDYKSSYVLILQLCQGGQLFKKILVSKHLSQKYIAKVIKQILKAILYLNHKGVIHRDIKPENMLFEKGTDNLKIIDFGIATKKKDKRLDERVGTPYYVAPEVLLKSYDQKCDVWSTGVIMYMMMTHRPPFRGQDQLEVMHSILSAEPSFNSQVRKNYSPQCINFVQSLLHKNPYERIEAQKAYNSPWLSSLTQNEKLFEGQKEIIQQIENFKFKNKLEAVVYTYLVSQLMNNEEKCEFIRIFEELDRNHDGVISKLQFREALKEKSKIQDSRVSLLMRIIDTNSSGYIDLTQFIVAGLKVNNYFSKEHFQQAFSYFDIDHSGLISYEEIAFFLQNPTESIDSIRRIFKDIDQNSDGVISREQFVRMFMKQKKGSNPQKKIIK